MATPVGRKKILLGAAIVAGLLGLYGIVGPGPELLRARATARPGSSLARPAMKAAAALYRITGRRESAACTRRDYYARWPGDPDAGRQLAEAGLELWDIGQTSEDLKTTELAVKSLAVLEWVQDRLETATEDHPRITLDPATRQRVQDTRPLVQDYLRRKGLREPD